MVLSCFLSHPKNEPNVKPKNTHIPTTFNNLPSQLFPLVCKCVFSPSSPPPPPKIPEFPPPSSWKFCLRKKVDTTKKSHLKMFSFASEQRQGFSKTRLKARKSPTSRSVRRGWPLRQIFPFGSFGWKLLLLVSLPEFFFLGDRTLEMRTENILMYLLKIVLFDNCVFVSATLSRRLFGRD